MTAVVMYALVANGADPVTAILTRDWAALGGWGLFISLVVTIVLGAFRGWWVAGWLYRQQAKVLEDAMAQNRALLAAADITKHFFESTAPKRGGAE